jgi:hypothetical protein
MVFLMRDEPDIAGIAGKQLRDVLFFECLLFVQEQSSGEWGAEVEHADADKLATFVRGKIASAIRSLIQQDRPEGGQ